MISTNSENQRVISVDRDEEVPEHRQLTYILGGAAIASGLVGAVNGFYEVDAPWNIGVALSFLMISFASAFILWMYRKKEILEKKVQEKGDSTSG